MRAERERVLRQHAAIDQMATDFAAGKRKAVADYFRVVLYAVGSLFGSPDT